MVKNNQNDVTKIGYGLKTILKNNEEVTNKTYELNKLKITFPQYFDKDGKFDFDKFKNAFDNKEFSDEVFSNKESYSINFVGKKFAQIQCGQETTTVITPDLGHNNNPENINSENIYIKGDNLDAIKHLLKSYKGLIKCIYIDPPYNTGSDNFAYSDNFKYDKNSFIKMGLSEEEAQRVERLYGKSTHSAWLTYMLPRLTLARDLLTEDGVIFISIDDNEYMNLKEICCNEIFGEENVDTMIWRKSGSGRDGKMKNTTTFRKDHEYIVVCFNNELSLNKSYEKPNWENDYGNPDNDPRGPWLSGSISRADYASNENSENYYEVTSPSGKKITRQFEISKEEFLALDKDGRISWGKDGNAVPRIKTFINEKREITTSSYIVERDDYISATCIDEKNSNTTKGSKELEELLHINGIGAEMRPKPADLIEKLIQIGSNSEDIILDFFSGSATTAQAVMQLNAEKKEKRKYILVQLQEETKENSVAKKAGFNNICEIGIKRIKCSAQKIKNETNADIDYGFKIYELNTPSNDLLDKVESFDESLNQLYSSDFRDWYKFNNIAGEETILQTWKVQDGYGFTAQHEELNLDGNIAYKVDKTLYLINPTANDFVKVLTEKLENELNKINKIVVFGYSYTFVQMQSLKINIKNYNDAIKNVKTEIITEVRY